MSGNRTVIVRSPAKINLGLEILGRRDDGYHDIKTVLATIDLSDELIVTIVPERPESTITGVPNVPPDENLISKAIAAFSDETGIVYGYDIIVDKRIPSPGGLGGASSNAASILMALNATHGTPLPSERMHTLAAKLGSDVPFFLGAPVALATGTGTYIQALGTLTGGVVVVVPALDIPAKTATLYSALAPQDYSDGARSEQIAQAVSRGELPSPELLENTFTRPLYELEPRLKEVAERVLSVGAPHVALTGAGPGHYVLLPTLEDARSLVAELQHEFQDDTFVDAVSLYIDHTSVRLQEP